LRASPYTSMVNNAALGTDGLLANMRNSQIEELLRVNTLAPVLLSKYVVRSMMADGGGRIVNVTSIIGFTGYSGLSVYGATKASMIGFTRSLAREVGPYRIRVNAIAPGHVPTPRQRQLWHDSAAEKRLLELQCLPDRIEPQDVAQAALFLCSDAGRAITKQCIAINAGSL